MIYILIGCIMTIAQVPNTISYQAVLRDIDGALLSEQEVDIEFVIVSEQSFNNVLFKEIHEDVMTTKNGLVSLLIGEGDSLYKSLDELNWNDAFAVEIYIDGEFMSSSEFTSTPYAITAKYVEGIDFGDFLTKGDLPVNKTDTIYTYQIDTIYTYRIDTMYSYQVDTVYHNQVDTLYVIDTTEYVPKKEFISVIDTLKNRLFRIESYLNKNKK